MPAGPLYYSNRALSMANQVLWCGDYDLEILRLSNVFPATLDAQPIQMQKRITEMLPPLVAAVQQRGTVALRLQTAGERNDALNKQAAEEQKAESKDCSFRVPTSCWLVTGLRQRLARTICQPSLTCSP